MSISSGDNCPKCGRGRMRVRTSRPIEGSTSREQRLECTACDHKATGLCNESSVWRRNRGQSCNVQQQRN